ncbi:hypothetical protein NM208_g7423 [Fusarium decemcellulare]|uniref:Uncharacterized protein n=1 Tax=Fusarium decemcellulare TaxID=57161 RepID=A0ACC1S997_9HYPO|nr:hypothetical protein NM208_g7423 [Fusarium decemcellulare]
MRRAHSFVIAEKNRLVVEIETLLAYFHLAIFGYFECLYRGSQRHTAEAAQQHMVGKSHFKFDLSDHEGSDDEVGDDGEDGRDIEEEADGAKGAGPSKFGQLDGATLRLPSGKLLSRIWGSPISHQFWV